MRIRAVLSILVLVTLASRAPAQSDNPCDLPGESPDLSVGAITSTVRYGSEGGVTAFALGTTTCNLGTCWLKVFASTPEHPVIGQNMFRLRDGRFEQLGQSWLMHTYAALQGAVCSSSCNPAPDVTHLGVDCSDAHSSASAGAQNNMGPKSEVNPYTGAFPFPATNQHAIGTVAYKRLQVHDADLDPALNPGALYFVESQHIARDDAAGGRGGNNASYRQVVVSGAGGTFNITLTGTTQPERAAIQAWKASDPSVTETTVAAPGDGRFIVAAKATALGGGIYRYEYAVQNLDAHRAARSFRVDVPPGAVVTNAGFHDVDYHSGEPYDGADWDTTAGAGFVAWRTDTFADDANANALRWGTLYNFRFDADVPPAESRVFVELFRPGYPDAIAATVVGPSRCDHPGGASDADGDGVTFCAGDCDDGNPAVHGTPGEVPGLSFAREAANTTLSWSPPPDAGGGLTYDVLRSADPGDFSGASCVESGGSDEVAADGSTPAAGQVFFYLVRARNACPAGDGSAGVSSSGTPRPTAICL